VAEQQRPQVRIGVHAVAVGMLRIVVHPLGVAGDHLLEEPLDVREERNLELVDEKGACRVHRPQAHDPLADIEPADVLHHAIREIDELDPLIGLDDDRLPMNRQAAGLRRSHLFDRLLANRHG
jgi:hypothetical protein